MRNRHILLLAIFTFLVPVLLFGGTTGKISGRIVDKDTNDPLPAVNVIIVGTTMGAATDLNGEFFILNVPAGTYSLRAEMIGYTPMIVQKVRVQVDLTTRQDFKLSPTILEAGETVTITAERPLIQKDLTASRTITTSEEILRAPLEDVQAVVALVAGTVGGNFRGGRSSEAVYTLEGSSIVDPMGGNYTSDVPLLSLQEMSVETSGFSAEYGNVQSGMVNMVMKEGGPVYSGIIRYKTNDFGSFGVNKHFGHSFETLKDIRDNQMETQKYYFVEALQNFEGSFGGPIPLVKKLGVPGRANFFVAGELFRSNNTQRNWTWRPLDKKRSISGKITYSPSPNYKIAFTGFDSWRDARRYVPLWSHTTREVVENEDLNHNGEMTDTFNMLDHLPKDKFNTQQYTLTWTQTLSARTYYELKFSKFTYNRFWNVDEKINEDTDGDGHLDLVVNGVDVDGDGDNRMEDLNGNGVWDWKVYGPKTDLFVDENDNGYIDASEHGPKSNWVTWQVLPLKRSQDTNGFYLYGKNENVSYPRGRWHRRIQNVYGAKFNLVSQVTPRHQLKTGASFDYIDIFSHDVDLASGGNVYGENFKVFPFQWAAYAEDKMEYEGMILNLGFRFDQFDANYGNYPRNPEDPVPDSLISSGGVIKDPVRVPAKNAWSPRIGVAFPITERDLLHFNYGRYFQQPVLNFAFRNLTFDLSGAFPLIGNPNIDPERTTAYEFGVKHQFGDNLAVNAVGFYKDITGLTDTKRVYYTIADWYGLYINQDFGDIRGFEVNIYKRPSGSDFLSGSLNYTYSVAKGKSSTSRQSYDFAWSGDIVPTTESYLNWDVRHNLKVNLDYRIPHGTHWLGTTIFDDTGINIINYLRSGLPYSPPKRSKEPLINTERLPGSWTVNLNIDKRFFLSTRYKVTFFVWINNLFDRRNINDGGVSDEEWYYTYKKAQDAYKKGDMSKDAYMSLMDQQDPLDYNHNGTLNEPDGKVDLNKKYPEMGSKLDPRTYDPGRNIRFGVSFEF
ncbi:MAG: TonB-dependent receptor [Calditrichaeota bacterium]|nr:TonB-dependent receptor [Calditrichota bacterium]